jgi:predicted transposase/invertase (TIGR01784 family)
MSRSMGFRRTSNILFCKRYSTSVTDFTNNLQVFSRPTYDRIAKLFLSQDESVRIDMLSAFTGMNFSSAALLDEHYNPLDPYDNLRKLISSKASQGLFEEIRDSSNIELTINDKSNKHASEILKGFSNLYSDLIHAFPNARYRSSIDFFCETDFGFVTVEFQVAKQDYWDKRALAYLASIYGNQLKPGQRYDQLRNVIGVNLLGDGSTPYWKNGDFVRDYQFVNQRGDHPHKIPAMRLIQYSLGDVDFSHPYLKENIHLAQWIDFFKTAHEKKSIPSPIAEPLQKAYEAIRVDKLKKEHPDLLKASDEFFISLTEHDQAVKLQGIEQGIEQVARNMKHANKTIDEIVQVTGLSEGLIKRLFLNIE